MLRFVMMAISVIAAMSATKGTSEGADFYAGKRLTILVNYAAGGPADIDARVFSRALARHIAGQPTVIVQNMDGAGGQVGVNYLLEVAPKDGSVVGLLTGSAFHNAAVAKSSRGDFKAMEFVAAQPATSVYYIRADVKPGIKNAVDLAKADGVIVGGLAADSSKDILLRLSLDMLGVKHKYVTSYRGTNAVRLALQQGEVNMTSESPPAYRGVVEPGLVKQGIAVPVFYDPAWDGKTFKVPNDVADLPIMPYQELYKAAKGEMPKGQLWDAYLSIVGLNGNMFRLFALPPGSPKDAAEALRIAVQRLATDKEFAAETVKAFGYTPGYDTSPDLSERVRASSNLSAEQKAFFAEYVAKATNGGAAEGKK